MTNITKRSPLFYVGDKYKLMPQLLERFPANINSFYEPFVGGGTVFLNVEAKKYFLNDIDKNLIMIHKYLKRESNNPKEFFENAKKLIIKYKLSRSYIEDVVPKKLKSQWVKTYYAKFNKIGYEKLRNDFNNSKESNPLMLYLLLIYGFNRMLRFNKNEQFNLPVGNVDFNNNVKNSLKHYFNTVRHLRVLFSSNDFSKFLNRQSYCKDDFVYVDPPYLITFSEYNKHWNENREKELLKILDYLNSKNVSFALSNVAHYNGDKNKTLISWMKKYRVNNIKSNYISFNDNSTKKNIREILVTNY